MKMKTSKYLPGFLAVGAYLFLLTLLVFYFNNKNTDKAKKYVEKDEHRIQVALSSSSSKAVKKKKPHKVKKVKKKKVPKKVKQKPKVVKKKRVIKEKKVKKHVKKRDHNKTKVTKRHVKDLFAHVTAPERKNFIQMSDKPVQAKKSASSRIDDSLKNQKNAQSGVESAYLAKVQRLLEGWPAQSEFAGQKVKVVLHIEPNGFFEFRITSASNNRNFNKTLKAYLEQLQEYGFGRHKGSRTYNFEAEFIAKE